MNRSWRVDGGILRRKRAATAEPGPGEVLVAMRAAALNYRDLGILAGTYPNRPGVIALSDGAGIVEAIGPGVEGLATGVAVVSCFYPFWQGGPAGVENHRASLGCELNGVLADHAVLPASAVLAKPAHLDFAEAATLPCAALTAWTALFTEGKLRPGHHVLIQGTGGVALFALQFAVLAGARATVISSDDSKLARVRAMGADGTINYRTTPDWAAAVLDMTAGRGADLILELGGADTLPISTRCIAVGGRIAVIGVLSGLTASLSVADVLFRHIRLSGVTVGHRNDFAAMNAAVERAVLRPVIEKRFTFDEAPDMYNALPQGRHFGKLVLEF